jgi:hypothetical protein
MSIVNHFLPAPGYPVYTVPPATPEVLPVSALGRFYDMKNSISFSTDISLPTASYRVTKFSVDIDRTDKSSADNVLHKPYDLLLKLQSSETTNNLRLQPTTISTNHCDNITYPFVNGNTYRILYEIYISRVVENVTTTKYKLVHTQYFTYFANPVTLSNFVFSDNVEQNDPIYVSGLLLVPPTDPSGNLMMGADTTIPQDTDDFGAIQFTFQEAEPCSGTTLNNQPTERFVVDMSYNPVGIYPIQPNASYSLQSGKIYKVDAEANWALGYSTFTRSSQNLYILKRPVITSVDVKSLVTESRTTHVVDITIDTLSQSGAVAVPSKIWFEFYDSSNNLVAITGGTGGVDASGNPTSPGTTISGNLYPFGLDEINRLGGEGLIVNTTYKVKAVVKYDGESCLPNTPQWRRSDAIEGVTFALVTPVISSISPYDIQNDGGSDGVFHPSSTDVDSTNQIVATVSINNAAYELYAPSHIKFNIYNSSGNTKLAETSEHVFKNSLPVLGTQPGTELYDIELDDITILSGSALTNGTPYKVKAVVRLLDHDSTPNPEWRESDSFTDVTFSQNIAPVPSVTISNTWALNTDNNPSSSTQRFGDSPPVGVSGYFMKTAQFGSSYSRQLDVTTTKFRIEYSIDAGSSWVKATRAVLGQKLSTDAFSRGIWRVVTKPVTASSTGEYSNVEGSGVGTSQQPMVFYIPQDQGSGNAFTESDTVQVRVTVIDTTGMWAPGNNTSPPTTSNSIQLINKINSYNFAIGQASEPWNSATDDSKLYVHVNGNVVGVSRAQIKASSNNIIEELDEGFRIINTGVGTNGASAGALPKANIYFYGNEAILGGAQPTSSNSFKVNQINGIGAYAVIHQNAGAKEYPYFVTYTTPTASDNNDTWFKSSVLYAPDAENNQWNIGVGQNPGDTVTNPSRVGLTLLYTGTDDGTFRPDIPASRRVKHVFSPQYSDANPTYDTEYVKFVTLQTSSNATTSQAGNFNFTLSEAGLTTSSSVLSTLVMSFTKNLILNIPVEWNSIHAHSVRVGYKYDPSHSYIYRTFNAPTPTNPPPSSTVKLYVEPTRATTLYYSVAYIVNNVNLSSSPYTTQGLTVEKDVQNKFFPESSDYTVSNTSYMTFNSDSESSITFDLALAADSKNRMDGVNVYFESPSVGTGANDGSNIPKVRIGTYTTSVVAHPITLIIDVSGNDGGILKVLNPAGTDEINFIGNLWGNYDMANITFEAYRDARVSSVDASYNPINSASNPVPSGFYVESGGQSTFGTSSDSNPIWNVLDLTPPNEDASGNNIYKLSGGVVNIEAGPSFHVITWPTASNNNGVPFTYDLKITKNDITVLEDLQNQTGPSYVIPIDLVNLAKYTIEITKVFNGLITQRELSPTDTVVFHSVEVDTSGMALSVQNPSNTSSVTLSWLAPDISGNSVTESGFEASSFTNNIHAQYIKYSIGNTGNYARLDTASSASLIESSPSLYTLPNQTLGTLYDFVVYVEAQVRYTLNGVVSSTKSVHSSVPFTPQVPTAESKYIVSTIPSIIVPHTSPVLVQGSSNPTLLLNLNASGLEVEGFISVVVILTQDGTASKPEGEQALLIFPDNNTSHPFSFPNTVNGISGAGAGDIRLAGGDTATSFPRNELQPASSLSTQSHSYTLTIGTTGSDGRYGLSTLQMPSSANSGFVGGSPVNYMVILTTRRGTDIGVGEFTYEALPSVQNVQIVTENGQYYVQFDVNPA